MDDKVILVTGGTGKTGRRVVAKLEEQGCKTRIASRQATENEANVDRVRFD